MNAKSIVHCVIFLLAVFGADCDAAFGEPATQLKWETLIPSTPPLENFLEAVPPDQQEALSNLDYWNSFPEGDVDKEVAYQREETKKGVDADRDKFAKQGVDLDALYQHYLAWVEEIDRRGKLTDKELDGKRVAIAGYLLPLDFNPKGTSEFLLVPYVGACIHVPPPPPNQVIYVRSSSPYGSTDLFEGVLITGTMKVQSAKKDLSFIDGSSEVDSGYVLEGEKIEPYQYEEGGQ
ncbi:MULTISPECIES: DUF3299 domain-containing protein [unclassified Rhizobium]|uniref:DUF3299 domain-containing protein n=1 Tax=unclassified Rhizobium TaxID=2613769 RepID=UPI0016153989|nr:MULTISPECIES: DUF3299 domain-containing protein [unclassified Rhizobium]MBB3398685.1 hypothetical protein [Rhizobium sp. BK060]MBB4170562.1 hypothetical protein [Rhizobium sp. BK538]